MKVLELRKVVFGFFHIPCVCTVLDHLFGIRLGALEMCHVLVHRGLPTVVDHDSTNCTIDELFADCALPTPPGSHHCGDLDPYRTIGRTSVFFLSPLALNDFGK